MTKGFSPGGFAAGFGFVGSVDVWSFPRGRIPTFGMCVCDVQFPHLGCVFGICTSHVWAVFLECAVPTFGLRFWAVFLGCALGCSGLLLVARTDCGRHIPALSSFRHCGVASLQISTFLDPFLGFFGNFLAFLSSELSQCFLWIVQRRLRGSAGIRGW